MLGLLLASSGCSAPHPPDHAAVPAAGQIRSGTVYLVRGLLGTFSTGMDEIRDQLTNDGVRAVAIQHTAGADAAHYIIEHHDLSSGPLVIVGHSLGADAAISLTERLDKAHVPVDLLITLDPVTPDDVPENVRVVTNYFRSNGIMDTLPVFRGIPLKARGRATALQNLDLNNHPELLESGTNHFTIDTNHKLETTIVRQILGVCVPEPADAIIAGSRISAPKDK